MHEKRPPTQAEIVEFMAREFPQCKCRVLDVAPGVATVAHEVGPDELRPGGTVSGPVLMTVADVGLYVARPCGRDLFHRAGPMRKYPDA